MTPFYALNPNTALILYNPNIYTVDSAIQVMETKLKRESGSESNKPYDELAKMWRAPFLCKVDAIFLFI